MPSTNRSSSPVSVPITIDILTEGGQVVTTHRRALGEGRTDISDYSTTLAVPHAMEMACARGNLNICDASVLAARITGYGIDTPPEAGPSLAAYDEAFLKKGCAVS